MYFIFHKLSSFYLQTINFDKIKHILLPHLDLPRIFSLAEDVARSLLKDGAK